MMSRMDVQIGTRLGGAALDARGKLFLSDDKRLEMAVSARGLDVREMVAGAPRTRIDMTGEIAADLKNDGELTGNVSIPFLGGEVAGALIPSTALRATALRTATNRVSGDADIVVREPGAPANVHVRAIPKGDSFALDFGLHAASPNLSRVPALRGEARGRLALSADGSFDVQTKAIAARLHATASDLVKGAAQLRSASADVRVSGLATAARLDGDVHVRGAEIGGLRLVSADMRSKSTMTESHVEISTRGPDTPDLDASADVRVADGLRLDQTRAVLARAGERATVTASRITADGGHLRIDGATIHGLGAPVTADVELAAQRVRVKASTGGGFLDLARVARLAHVETILKGGGAALDADFAVRRNDASGRAKLDVTGAAIGNARGVSAHLDAKLAGHSLSGQVQARADGVGSIDLEFPRVDLSGSAGLSGESWRRVVGSAAVDARVDLARLAAIVPASQYPLSESRGQVSVKGSFSRQDAAAVAPNADLSVTTSGLAIAPREAPSTDYDGVTVMSQPWHLEGIDFDIAANVDGPRGSIRVSTTARDAKGTIAQLDASATHVPLEDLFAHTTGLATYFRSTPFDIRVQVPERKLGELPPLLRRGGFESGVIRGDVRARGTLLSPEMDASISLRRSHLGSSSLTEPLDSELTAHYDGQRARLLVQAASGGRELARADVHADFAAARLVAGAAPEWDASGRAHFAEFPLQAVALLDDKQVCGTVTGDIDLEGLHEDARLQAALDVAGLRIGRLAYRSARLNAKADGRTADATIRVDQEDGFFEAKAHAIASWGSRLAPALDSAQPLGLNLLAKNFRIAGLQPLVDGTLDEIDGRVDADTRIELDPAARVPHFVGQVELSQGKVEAVAGGGELHDIAATVKFAPNGVVTLDRLSAAGVSGRLEANASAQLNGLTLESAKGVILIPKSSPMPLSAGGAEIGDVDGRVEITATTTPKGSMDVKVEVPHLRVAVPEASPNGVQALGPIDNVRIGVHRGTPARFVLLPLDSNEARAAQFGLEHGDWNRDRPSRCRGRSRHAGQGRSRRPTQNHPRPGDGGARADSHQTRRDPRRRRADVRGRERDGHLRRRRHQQSAGRREGGVDGARWDHCVCELRRTTQDGKGEAHVGADSFAAGNRATLALRDHEWQASAGARGKHGDERDRNGRRAGGPTPEPRPQAAGVGLGHGQRGHHAVDEPEAGNRDSDCPRYLDPDRGRSRNASTRSESRSHSSDVRLALSLQLVPRLDLGRRGHRDFRLALAANVLTRPDLEPVSWVGVGPATRGGESSTPARRNVSP